MDFCWSLITLYSLIFCTKTGCTLRLKYKTMVGVTVVVDGTDGNPVDLPAPAAAVQTACHLITVRAKQRPSTSPTPAAVIIDYFSEEAASATSPSISPTTDSCSENSLTSTNPYSAQPTGATLGIDEPWKPYRLN